MVSSNLVSRGVINNIPFNENTDCNSVRQHSTDTQGISGIQSEIVDLEAKNKKRKKITRLLTAGATILGASTIVFSLIYNKNKKNNPNKLFEKTKKTYSDLKLGDKVNNAMTNIINIKDDIYDRFLSWTDGKPLLKPFRKISNWITNIYKNSTKIMFGTRYTKAYDEVIKQAGNNKIDIEDFDKWFNSINQGMDAKIHKTRLTKGIFKKGIFKKFFGEQMGNEHLKDVIEKSVKKVEIDSSWTPELKKAVENFNKTKADISKTLVPKLRDINFGSAPTDLLTIVVSTLGLTGATIAAPDKEKRKSILTRLGIPLIVTLAGTTYGNLKCLSGMKSFLFSLAIGQVGKYAAIGLDKALNKHKNDNKIKKNAQ